MPSPKRPYQVGDHIRIALHGGRIEEGVIRAIHEHTNEGVKLQVDFGHDETALVPEWRVVKEKE